MSPWSTLAPVVVLVAPAAAAVAEEAFVCNVGALTAPQRERHQKLGRLLRSAVVERAELESGYVFVLDLGRLPIDSAGAAFCVVEVAEWVDLESRCCPFLSFGIEVEPKPKTVRLRLTGGKGSRRSSSRSWECWKRGSERIDPTRTLRRFGRARLRRQPIP